MGQQSQSSSEYWEDNAIEYCSAIKKKKRKEEWNFPICNNMDGPGGHYDKWN